MRPPVAIILLNWNGWRDTLECLESCLKLDYPNVRIILCDNASTDGSVERVREWAEGSLPAPVEGEPGRRFAQPPAAKPVRLDILSAAEAKAGARPFENLPALTVIETGENGGFAAGNNVGLDYASRCGARYHWVLNTDTVVAPEALGALVERMERDPGIGQCGSRLAFYDQPDTLQLAGGCAYYSAFGMARRLGADRPREAAPDAATVERRLGFVSAASCLVSDAFFRDIGPMCEDYFFYCEEIDWALRSRGRFRLGYAASSHVYHKAGRSAGSKGADRGRSAFSTYHLWRARRMVTRKYHPYGLPGLAVLAVSSAGLSLVSGDLGSANAIMRGVLGLARASSGGGV
ncbi:MAG: glycosyltransferase family 2 protein [Rhodobacteraceae bacterium]|nr:glycosyltransferase family 2 protein [Paracoccaceae bacterium]